MPIKVSKRKSRGRGRVVRINDEAYKHLHKLKRRTGRAIGEIAVIAILQARA